MIKIYTVKGQGWMEPRKERSQATHRGGKTNAWEKSEEKSTFLWVRQESRRLLKSCCISSNSFFIHSSTEDYKLLPNISVDSGATTSQRKGNRRYRQVEKKIIQCIKSNEEEEAMRKNKDEEEEEASHGEGKKKHCRRVYTYIYIILQKKTRKKRGGAVRWSSLVLGNEEALFSRFLSGGQASGFVRVSASA